MKDKVLFIFNILVLFTFNINAYAKDLASINYFPLKGKKDLKHSITLAPQKVDTYLEKEEEHHIFGMSIKTGGKFYYLEKYSGNKIEINTGGPGNIDRLTMTALTNIEGKKVMYMNHALDKYGDDGAHFHSLLKEIAVPTHLGTMGAMAGLAKLGLLTTGSFVGLVVGEVVTFIVSSFFGTKHYYHYQTLEYNQTLNKYSGGYVINTYYQNGVDKALLIYQILPEKNLLKGKTDLEYFPILKHEKSEKRCDKKVFGVCVRHRVDHYNSLATVRLLYTK